MAKVSLRIYTHEIESLIDQNQFDEAVAHCKHILKTFPKYLEIYRLLGKNYLETKRYNDAAEIFQRVLLAVPDDFVSHVGMSIICDDDGKLDDAIWHMERAFERQPSNAAVQGELQRLYGRRDGVQPPKIRMTRGALAHMYVQGELYPQAIGEIRGVLAEDPNRMDMQALLALAYFRNGQKVEASEVCSTLLKKYTYCLDANRILVEILPGTGRAEDTQVYRHRVNEMDPYAAFASGSVFRSDTVPDAAVSLERLSYAPGQMADLGTSWPASLELMPQSSAASEYPEWLKSADQESMPETPSTPEPAPPPDGSIPDFMRVAGWGAATGAALESASTFGESQAAEPDHGDAVPADIPDWLKAMAPSETDAAAPTAQPLPAAATPEIPAAPESEDTMDWLNNLGAEKPSAEEPASQPDAFVPDWLTDTGSEPDEPSKMAAPLETSSSIGDLGKTDEERDESFLWLESLAAKQGARSDELLTNPDERLEAAPEWVEQAKDMASGQEASVDSNVQEALPADSTPDWLKETGSEEKVEEPPAVAAPVEPAASIGDLGTTEQERDESFLWLESLAAKQGARSDELLTEPDERLESAPEWVEQAKDVVASVPGAEKTAEQESEDWLKELQPSEDSPDQQKNPETLDSTGAWLRGLEEAESAPDRPLEPAMDMPDWLKAQEEPASDATVAPVEREFAPAEPVAEQPLAGEEMPDWLDALGGEAEQAVEPQVIPDREEQAPVAAVEPALADAEVPDWLKEMESPSRGTQPLTSEEELPDWLRTEAQDASSLQPTSPAEWKPAETPAYSEPITQPLPEEKKPLHVTPSVQPVAAPQPIQSEPEAVHSTGHTGVLSTPADPTLRNAQFELNRGNVHSALQEYGKLIKKARLLDEVIFDLREALYRYPVDVAVWQALGDAYMRANRLQDALDAYTKAEELLR